MNSSMQSITINDGDEDAVSHGKAEKSSSDSDTANINSGNDNDEKTTSAAKDEKATKENYFKGYFVFALWEYIPPTGGEKYYIVIYQNSCKASC